MFISRSWPPIQYVTLCSSAYHNREHPNKHDAFCSCPPYAHVCPSTILHFDHAYLTLMSTHQACRMLLIGVSRSRAPIKHVAFCSCLSYGHVHASIDYVAFCSCLSHAHVLPSSMSHFAQHGRTTITSTHQACRTLLMFISCSCPTMDYVGRILLMFLSRSCPLRREACRILLMVVPRSRSPIKDVTFCSCLSHVHARP